jgi:hypothetical protein
VLPLTLSCRSVVLPRTVHRVMLSRRSVRGSLRYFYVPTITTTRTFVRAIESDPSACCFAAPRPPTSSPTCTSRTVRISVISYQTAHVTSWVQPSCCRCRRHGLAMAARGGDRASSVMARDPRIPIAGHERRSARQLMADAWTALQDSGKIVAPRRTRGRPPSNLRAVGQNHQGSARPRDAIRAYCEASNHSAFDVQSDRGAL